MKNFMAVLTVVALCSFFSAANAEESQNPYYDRMSFVVEGDVMVYVDFPFEVPSGNCGQVEVYEYQQSYSYPPTPASWKLLTPGTVTTFHRGIYWFKSAPTDCSPVVEISGQPFDTDVYSQWTGLEVEPADIGLLSTMKEYGNVFRLNEDDTQFSYVVVFNPHGYKTDLGTIMNDPNNFNMHCESAGVILPDQRGFLDNLFLWGKMTKKQQEAYMKSMIIDRDDIFINICREQ